MLKAIVKKIYIGLGKLMSAVLPIDYRKVVLISNYGRGYLCNPKYIAEGLNRYYPGKFRIVLLVREYDASIPDFVTQKRYRGLSGLLELSTARFWVNNCREPLYATKRDNQIYIQTWHGYAMIKRVEKDAGCALGDEYQGIAKEDGRLIDLMFTDNDFQEHIFRNSFWYEGPVIRCDVPRNEILIGEHPEVAERVRWAFGLDQETKICLYAPTFRKDLSLDSYCIDFTSCQQALEARFGGRFVVMYRLHPNIASAERPAFFDGCVDATSYNDTQELLAAADVLVSDYSSIMEDYALTGKPGFMYAPDIDAFKDDRGFYYGLQERPFPLATSPAELFDSILDFDYAKFEKSREAFFDFLGLKEKGNGGRDLAVLIDALAVDGSVISDVL